MSLRKQLVIIGAIILLLPMAVIRFAVVLEESLRASQESSHLEITRFISEALSPYLSMLPDSKSAQLITPLSQHIIPDGYQNDWSGIPWISIEDTTNRARAKLGIAENHLYILLTLKDHSVLHQTPSETNQLFDQLNLSLQQKPWALASTGQRSLSETSIEQNQPPKLTYTIFSDGPGPVQLSPASDRNLTGVWQINPEGSVIELKVAIPEAGLSSISLVWQNVSKNEAGQFTQQAISLLGSTDHGIPVLYWEQASRRLASSLTPENTQLRILNHQQQLLFEQNRAIEQEFTVSQHPWRSLLRQLLTSHLTEHVSQLPPMSGAQTTPYTVWEKPKDSNAALLISYYPVFADSATKANRSTALPKGWVSLKKPTNRVAALADDAVFQVLTRVTLVMLVVVAGLFGYASWLSLRIGKLKQQIIVAMDPEYGFQVPFQSSMLNDELGDLSRSFANMLGRLQSYSEYMESFASKLTHECRTPLAIVSSSLQLLASAEDGDQQQKYLRRAQLGTARISALLTAMRQATQLEASIQQQEKEQIDLVPLIRELSTAYHDLLPKHQICCDVRCESAVITGNAELLAQAIDKLIENAKDFTPQGKSITLGISCEAGNTSLWVENQGKPIDDKLLAKLFDPFISQRNKGGQSTSDDDELHLGLGLVIVKLIADFHDARVSSENLTAEHVTEEDSGSLSDRVNSDRVNSDRVNSDRVKFTLYF